MPRRFVDLSIFLENDVVSDPPAFAPRIQPHPPTPPPPPEFLGGAPSVL